MTRHANGMPVRRRKKYLKTSKITYQDIGQMDMYIRMYDELKNINSICLRKTNCAGK